MTYDPQRFQGLADARRVLADSPGAFATQEELEAFWRYILERKRMSPKRSDEVLRARVDHGRWLADCPVCVLDAALCVPGFDKTCCLGCGTFFRVVFPSDEELNTATLALSLRPVALRNWDPAKEPAGSLVVENLAHGLPA